MSVTEEWDKRQKEMNKDVINYDERIIHLKTQAKMTVDKIKFLTSELAIRYMEQDLIKAEQEIGQLMIEKEKTEQEKPVDARIVMAYIKYYLEHMDELLLDEKSDPILRANCFGILFDNAPTYQEIDGGTPNLASCIKLNEVFISTQGKLAAQF